MWWHVCHSAQHRGQRTAKRGLLFYHVGPREQTPDVRLGSKHLYLQSHLLGPGKVFQLLKLSDKQLRDILLFTLASFKYSLNFREQEKAFSAI